jgi:hypothetical protein
MPSTTPKQARLMAAVAHGWHKPGGGGPPVSVAKEFNQADKGSAMLSKGMHPKVASYAAGGPVLGRTRDFLKEQVEFRDMDEGEREHDNSPTVIGDTADEDQKYAKSGIGAGKGQYGPPPPNTKKKIR